MAPTLPTNNVFTDRSITSTERPLLPCSDPSVMVSEDASERTKELWSLHGHPHADRYSNPKLVSLSALIEYNAANFQDQTAFLYPVSNEKETSYKSLTWDQFHAMTDLLAWRYAQELRNELLSAKERKTQPTVALLGVGTSLQYFATQMALIKLNMRVLLLADKNSIEAIRTLIAGSHATVLMTDSQNAKTGIEEVRMFPMLEDYIDFSELGKFNLQSVRYEDDGDPWQRHTFVLHSSGSTGPPKLITHTNRSVMLAARMYRLFPNFHIENWFLLSPTYHIAGLYVVLSGLPNGLVVSFPPLSWPPSASSLLAAWKTMANIGHPIDNVHCAPALIENLYDHITRTGGDFSPLASLRLLMPMGAKLSDSIVSSLVSHNVNVKTTYGSTEIGPVLRTIPHTKDNPNCYRFRNLFPDNDRIQMEELGESLYECIIWKGFAFAAELWDGKPDKEPYRTNDIFLQDPPGSGYYFLQGRRDDVLIHSDGNNTSAEALQVDIEAASSIIHKVVAVGQSRICVCLLVEVLESLVSSSSDTFSRVWEAVNSTNSKYPQHSRVLRSMIYILPKGVKLPVTPKGNVRRNEVLKVFAKEIDYLYSGLEENEQNGSLDSDRSLSSYLLTHISALARVPQAEIKETTNFYDIGIDSIAALQLRKALSSRVGYVSLGAIFEHPSVEQLVAFIQNREKSKVDDTHHSYVQRIIEQYSSEFSSWPVESTTAKQGTGQEIILLTGASGSLGTALLEALVAAPTVSRVYALLRGPNNLQKLEASLKLRGLDAKEVLSNNKVEVFDYSMKDPLLGLDVDTYHRLSKQVTTVLHNAWRVDFNQTVEGFESDCLRGTMSLLRFCLAGNLKALAFTSSVSTCLGKRAREGTILESPVGDDPRVAMRTGYAQSKYIVERITQLASVELEVKCRILRVGQLCGHSKSGYWSEQEMFPIIFATSQHLQAIPATEMRHVDWIPVDFAARTITDLLTHQSTEKYSVHNIVNPHPISWSALLTMLKKGKLTSETTMLKEVSMQEWVRRLNELASKDDLHESEVSGLKLLQFFEDMVLQKEEVGRFSTEKTFSISNAMRSCPEVCQEWIDLYIKQWKRSGFLKA